MHAASRSIAIPCPYFHISGLSAIQAAAVIAILVIYVDGFQKKRANTAAHKNESRINSSHTAVS